MSNKTYFTPGPSQMYPGMDAWFSEALRLDIPSISHRSKAFEQFFAAAQNNLKVLLDVPADYSVLFASSATAIWDMLAHNLVHAGGSLHLVNGSFSKRFFETVKEWKKPTSAFTAEEGHPFDTEKIRLNGSEDLLAVILNETSTGVKMLPEEIAMLRKRYPEVLIAADGVSAFPSCKLDFAQVDAAYFSVQKGFGMPAGLGVLIASPRVFEKAAKNKAAGYPTGSYQDLVSMREKSLLFQTNETPNVLGIWLLSKVSEAMLNTGIDKIRQADERKAASLYALFENHPAIHAAVPSRQHRSHTVVVANVEGGSDALIREAASQDMIVASGYGKSKSSQIRIANFPAVSEAAMEKLLGFLQRWRP